MRARPWLIVAALAGIALPFVAVRADDANRECDNNQDVTVVVDFQELGGGVNVRCATPSPFTNGFDVLNKANISYDQYQGFVCRIAGKPDSDPCNHYPPADAYWVYWTATRGGQWQYSKYGAGARKPPPGSLDGWSFAKDRSGSDLPPPRYPVPPPIAEGAATTTSGASADAATSPASPGATAARPQNSRATTNASSTSSTTSDPSVTTALASESTTTPTRSTLVALGDVDLSNDGGDGGTSAGFMASAAALATLAAGAVALARRRATS